ncbi:hypothetical protein [Amycolatopsis jiangsuensis]|uniref:Uncharacterized protein n=1 Tax=Amycolatopsis jiangsuensis TaxID=1181879 RepID=A0A840IQ75_9PSEU|nr:hypothetical protein [Amycolatopsis jiangsuensis]MBB4684060.1 hypothetical protein [Amycolatopsis jiangsuensis]
MERDTVAQPRVEHDSPVTALTLDRPQARTALPLLQELLAAYRRPDFRAAQPRASGTVVGHR